MKRLWMVLFLGVLALPIQAQTTDIPERKQEERLRALREELRSVEAEIRRLKESDGPGEDRLSELRRLREELRKKADQLEAKGAAATYPLAPPSPEPHPAPLGGNLPRSTAVAGYSMRESEELREFLRTFDPRMAEEMNRLRETGRMEEYRRLLHEANKRMADLKRMKEHNPDEYERVVKVNRLEQETVEMAHRLREGRTDNPPEKVRETLASGVRELFDLREESREREVKELRRRLEELEKSLEKRKANRERIIERRIRELLGEADDEGW